METFRAIGRMAAIGLLRLYGLSPPGSERSDQDRSEDEAAAWALIRAHGYDFTPEEFNEAKDQICKEFGITPL